MISDEDALRLLDSMSWNDNEDDLLPPYAVTEYEGNSIRNKLQDLNFGEVCEAPSEPEENHVSDSIAYSYLSTGKQMLDVSDPLNVITSRSGDATFAISASLLNQWMLEPNIKDLPEDSGTADDLKIKIISLETEEVTTNGP